MGSQRVVAAAAHIARSAGARLTLLHVLDYTPALDTDFPLLTPVQERGRLMAAARARLQALAAEAGCPDANIRVVVGQPQSEIPDAARAVGADLVIVGSWRNRLSAWIRAAASQLLGRPAWEVLRV